jgi:hypothetical protein
MVFPLLRLLDWDDRFSGCPVVWPCTGCRDWSVPPKLGGEQDYFDLIEKLDRFRPRKDNLLSLSPDYVIKQSAL